MKKTICFGNFDSSRKFIYKQGPRKAPLETPKQQGENLREKVQDAMDKATAAIAILRRQIAKVKESYENEKSPEMKEKTKKILEALERHLKTLEDQVGESNALLKPVMSGRQEIIEKTLLAIDELVEQHAEEVEKDKDLKVFVIDPMNPELLGLRQFSIEYDKKILEGEVRSIRAERARADWQTRQEAGKKSAEEAQPEEDVAEEAVAEEEKINPQGEDPSEKEKEVQQEKPAKKKTNWQHGMTVVAKLFALTQPQSEEEIAITTQEAAALPFFVSARGPREVWLDIETPEGKKISRPFKVQRSPKGGLIWLFGPDGRILAELPLRADKPEKSTEPEWKYAETAIERKKNINLETMTEEDVEKVDNKRLLAHLERLSERFLEYRLFENRDRAEFSKRRENLLSFAYKIREIIPKGWRSEYTGPMGEVAFIRENTSKSGEKELVLFVATTDYDPEKNKKVEREVSHYALKPPKEGEIETNVA